MRSRTRYRCKYCGVDDIRDTAPSWEKKNMRCKKCNHDKFTEKRLEAAGANAYGYDEEEKQELIQWIED
jgi:hypothetical protein